MAETQNKGASPASNELVSWLRMLALPLWIRAAISVLIVSIIASGLALLAHGIWAREAEQVSSAIALVTVSLPVLMIVIALVFGQNSDRKLKELTTQVLQHNIPDAVRANLSDAYGKVDIQTGVRGCGADYTLSLSMPGQELPFQQRFRVELNVRKANVCFWLANVALPARLDANSEAVAVFRHVILGALAEGYQLNDAPALSAGEPTSRGLLFFRSLDPEFLVRPDQRLYFVQDLSFCVRGFLDASLASTKQPQVRA